MRWITASPSITKCFPGNLSAADLIVVPTQPSPLDQWGQDAVMDRIVRLGLTHKMMFVLTRAQSGKAGADEAAKAKRYLSQRSPQPVPIMSERIDYRRAAEQGKAAWEFSKSKDIKAEIEKIWETMQKVMQKVQKAASTEQSNVVQIAR
jgi:cellulose biosynthesis protein BcsQ